MRKTIKILIAIAIFISCQLSTFNSANAQITCREKRPESCKPGKDGQAEVILPSALVPYCKIEWTTPEGKKLTGPLISGLKAGVYSVVVKALHCNNIIYQDVCAVDRESACKIGATISVSTEQVECNQQPTATLVASPVGGTPPYKYTWKTKTVSASGTYGVTITDSNGYVGNAVVHVTLQMQKCPEDPNEIDGPIGYGDDHLVSASERMRYTILYENSPEFASAPASLVNIVYPIPPEHNINSVRLSDFGFGSHVFSVPSNTTAYTQRLDVADSLGVWVDVTAGIDMANNQIFWNLQAVDPLTGFEPASSDLGFLLINDSLHHGEGYVSFSILPKKTIASGDTVSAEATIIFNENTAIATNVWVNHFDAVAPISTLHAEIEAADSMRCNFTFEATDDLSGVDNVELLVSRNGSAYSSEGYYATSDTAHYTLEDGYVYKFISRATDHVGNQEPLKSTPDTVINNNTAPVDILLSNNNFDENADMGVLIGTLTTIDNDITLPFLYELVSGEGDNDNLSFYIEGNKLYTGSIYSCTGNYDYSVRIRTTDITGLSFEKVFELRANRQNYPYYKSSYENICQGSVFQFGNSSLIATGTYTDSLTTSRGCDSIITIHLTVHPSPHNTAVQSVCENQSFTWTDHSLTLDNLTAGHYYYYDTLYTRMGCDSTFTLVLNVNPTSATTETADVCDSYTWNGTIYNASGVQSYQTTNVAGCDSTVTLNLTIRNSSSGTETQNVCDSYTWWNTIYTSSTNTPTHLLTNAAGCDSVVTLNLTVRYSSTGTDLQTACDSYTWHGNTYTSSTTTPTFVTTNAVGCDSTTTLNLSVNHSTSGTDVQNVCDSYIWIDGVTYSSSNSSSQYSIQNSVGCDSVVTLNLTVRYSSTGIETQNVCDSYTWHGTTYTASTTSPTFTEQNAVGCDSIVSLNLTIRHSSNSTDAHTACDSFVWHGTTYTASGTPTYQTLNAAGCDSTETLLLTINYSNSGTDAHIACDSYTWHGTTYTTSTNTPTFIDTNAAGCDSITTLNLTLQYSSSGDTTAVACDSFTWWNTNFTNSTNEATHLFTNAAGCDSVVTLHLTVNYSNNGDTSATACDSFTWWNTNFTNSTNEATHLFTNAAGCDSVVTLNLTINYSVTVYDSLTLAASEIPYNYHGNTVNGAGNYTFEGTTTAGCDSITLLHVDVLEGIDVTGPLAGLKVYPNPTRGTLTIEADDLLSVDVLDAVGRLVTTFEGVNTFNISSLPSGNYTLRIQTSRGETIRRIVKK